VDPATPPAEALVTWARGLAATVGATPGPVDVRAMTSGALVVTTGDVVVKVHPVDTDVPALAARLRLAAVPTLADVLATPLRPAPVTVPPDVAGPGRAATVWPRLDVLAPDVVDAPWAQAATTLARLHRTPAPDGVRLPAHGAPDRLARAVRRLAAASDRAPGDGGSREARGVVLRAGALVVREVRDARAAAAAVASPTRAGSPSRLVHGDWHLGQIGRVPGGGPPTPWLLIDLDDVGLGDPAWDLGRPAGFWAAGLLDDASWTSFLHAYRSAGGPGVPAAGDPWPALDLPARAEVVVAAARAVRITEGGDDEAEALVAACDQMAR